MIVAKAVVPDQYWILKQDDRKIGNIEADPRGGYQVKINNKMQQFETIPMVRKKVKIDFESVINKKSKIDKSNLVYGYDVGCRAYNAVWDVRHRLPLFTKEENSKSWYAAGWYKIKQHRKWSTVHNPKFIILERYKYTGPFETKKDANDQPV